MESRVVTPTDNSWTSARRTNHTGTVNNLITKLIKHILQFRKIQLLIFFRRRDCYLGLSIRLDWSVTRNEDKLLLRKNLKSSRHKPRPIHSVMWCVWYWRSMLEKSPLTCISNSMPCYNRSWALAVARYDRGSLLLHFKSVDRIR